MKRLTLENRCQAFNVTCHKQEVVWMINKRHSNKTFDCQCSQTLVGRRYRPSGVASMMRCM